MAALAPLIGENLGVQRATIEVQENGLRHSVRIGDAVDFEIEDVVPFGIETGEPVRDRRDVPSRRVGIPGSRGEAGEHQRVRHRVRPASPALSAPQFSWAAWWE